MLGFLPSYGQEEGIDSGHGIWLLVGLAQLAPLAAATPTVYAAGIALIFVGLTIAILRWRTFENGVHILWRDTGVLASAAMVATSSHYHWYFAWLALPSVVAPFRALLWLTTAPLQIEEPVPGDRFFWPSLVYVPAILLLLTGLRHRIVIKHRRGTATGDTSCPLRLP